MGCVWCLVIRVCTCTCIFVRGENMCVPGGVHMCVFSMSVENTCVCMCSLAWLSQGLTDGDT